MIRLITNLLRLWPALLVLALALPALADGHGRRLRRHALAAPAPPAYGQACGQCHMAYPAVLLPAGSWQKILAGRQDHFGQPLELTPGELAEISAYLSANAAGATGCKLGRKVLEGLDGQTPLRLSQTPYLLRKHRRLTAQEFARPAVGGRGNCRACHPGAEQGDFKDDRVSVPR